jgi:hypothetical protein
MSAVRLALLTGAATAASFGLFYLWLRSPLALALLGAALFGTAFMTVGASLGDDPLAADEAWRLEAGDLATREPPSITAKPDAPTPPAAVERRPAGSETGAETDPRDDAG